MHSISKALSVFAFFEALSLGLAAPLGNTLLASSDLLANGQDAQNQNAQFATLSESDSCTDGDLGCIGQKFTQCVGGAWQPTDCSTGTQCFALPLVNSRGTSVTCDTEADALARIQATGATGGITGDGSTGSNTTSSASGNVPSSPASETSIESSGTSATDSVSVIAASATGVEGGSTVSSSDTVAAVSSSPTSSGADGIDNDPNGEDGDDENCPSSEGDISPSSAAESSATVSADDIGSTDSVTGTIAASASASLGESSASSTISAENVSGSTSASLVKRQDAIGDIQSTLIPLSAVGSATPSGSASTGGPFATGIVSASDPLATGATSENISTTLSATGSLASGTAGEQTVTVTVTVTASGTIGSTNPISANATLATNAIPTDPAATPSQISPPSSQSGLITGTDTVESDPFATVSQSNSVVIGSATTPALGSESVAFGAPTSPVVGSPTASDNTALPTQTNPVAEPLLPSAAASFTVSPVSVSTAVPATATPSVASDIGGTGPAASPTTLSGPVTSEQLTTSEPAAASPSTSLLFDPSDISFLLTATI
ncbi:hypothetical protein ACEPAG_3515 [Sanghuangporus baumii]